MAATLFSTERDGPTMIVQPLANVTSLADQAIESELNEMRQAFDEGVLCNLIVDLGKINYFGSSMLEAMRSLSLHVRKAGGKMAVCNCSPVCREIIHIARFDTIWPIVDSRADAVATVAGDGG